jgi:tRNA (guanine-N7-)-methyltransferase
VVVTGGDGARSVRRPAASFKVRRRSLSPKRQAEFDEWIERWGLDLEGPVLDWAEVFGRRSDRPADVVLDVGFGHGESTIEMAAAQPDLDVIGVEVHTPGVVTVLDAIEHRGLRHIRVVHGDLLPFLDRVPSESLAVVRIYFPDPWTKRRNFHRRLVAPDVVSALTDRLRPGGTLHLATDIADYAAAMQQVCDAEPRLVGGVIDRPDWRPLTRFEQRGLDAGRSPTDLLYTRA